ncbi:MAG: TM0106 family RecB-like putative nuclease [Actinomycetia bacterium]|nr:TM0106 family RecB-like putative nuclease [Actinomycetes bacterium]
MQLVEGRLVFSPSDLSGFTDCAHLTRLETEVAFGRRSRPQGRSRYRDLIARKGEEHEASFLERLEAQGADVVRIDPGEPRDWGLAARRTEEAMRSGAQVIYQAVLLVDDPESGTSWRGSADFLERVERLDEPTALGPYSYEAVDTKLARLEKPSHILQLCFYSEGIARIQGLKPERFHVELGSGRRRSFALVDFEAYYRRVRAGFVTAVEAEEPTEPYPCEHCSICDFRGECDAWWDQRDHLTLVAGIRRDHVDGLAAAGIDTLTALAQAAPGVQVDGIRSEALDTLRDQARLQFESRGLEQPDWHRLELAEGRGFGLLPRPSEGDVIFDIEGDPWWEPARGLDFLFGLAALEEGTRRYQAIWGHDREGERRAFEELIDRINERRNRFPEMHVYHYGSYEQTAIKQLMGLYGTREEQVDALLRGKVFVDLHTVVRQALRVGVPSYSLKQIEQLLGFRRAADVDSGSEAVLLYEEWLTTGDGRLLDRIAAYNREDCLATLALRDWLLGVRPDGSTWFEPPDPREPNPDREAADAAREQLRLALADEASTGSGWWLAGQLLDYHRREARPGWWAYFDRRDRMSLEELVEDSEAIGRLVPVPGAEPVAVRKSRGYWLMFPEQQHKLSPGSGAADPATERGEPIEALDDAEGRLMITRGPKRLSDPLPQALIPEGPIWDGAQREALSRLGQSIRDTTKRYPALESILDRARPRFLGHEDRASIQTNDLPELRELAHGLDRSHLFIQGPPGSGKTWTASRIITHLIGEGQRVGVAATSHKAIHNLLEEIEHAAADENLAFHGLKKSTRQEGSEYNGRLIESVSSYGPFDDPDPGVRLFAGTSWLFGRQELDQSLDTLVIDEAGQVSLADALAIGTSARNVILLGDPLQLPQVVQGSHPEGSAHSILEHLLGDDPTIPPDRGIFLERTRRMHPDICRFISEIVYARRLTWTRDTERQNSAFGTGLRYLSIEHDSNQSASPEEAQAVAARISEMLGSNYTDTNGHTAPLQPADFMAVTPYNAQVRRLRNALDTAGLTDVPAGTVDKFQGQEAPVVFFSMATSTGEDVPRNLEFLFSRNRLNVAISRDKCLAHVVCNPRLLEAKARTIDQMQLINALCRFAELAQRTTEPTPST